MDDYPGRGPIPTFYTQKELSQLLNIAERTIEYWRFRGTGPAYVKFGGLVRYPESAVWDFIDAASISDHAAAQIVDGSSPEPEPDSDRDGSS